MFSFFARTFRQWARSGTKASARPAPARRLECEALEDRVVPSLTGVETLINTNKTGLQNQAQTATSSNGTSVIVWTDMKSSIDGDIKAQRLDAAGNKVGGEITVATGRSPQNCPTVAMDANGNFVVVWNHLYSSSDTDLHAALYRADGTKIGSEITVAQAPRSEYDASVAMAANGNFVVTYTYQYNSTDADVKGILYRANGTVVKTFDVAVTSRSESRSSVSMAADGRFAVGYVRSDDVVVCRYTAAGSLAGTHTVAATTKQEREPDVAMDNSGNVIVVWQENASNDWNVVGRRISNTGSLSSVFTIDASYAQETSPSVAIDSSTGKFLVAYQSQFGTNRPNVEVSEYTSTFSRIRNEIVGTSMMDPSVSVCGPLHGFLVAVSSYGSKGADFDGGVFARYGIL